ncbi:MAG: chromosome segregation protein ScpA [Cenarchaeum sp. SB0669_bin_11]|nr:chromosome segregation protein ScpA [Cenarchaeum sp. SB0675_bin_21]MYL11594.1 chromosome segregation protein ScpA [Cenarchaeum sp. SB0669_bin_11]
MMDTNDISKEPLNILFNPDTISKKNVWDIDLAEILNMLSMLLEKKENKDLQVAGIAALSSSLIYKMKVDSIFALQAEAMAKKPPPQRVHMDIQTIPMPYRHQSTYAVSVDDLLTLLQNLVVSMANPRNHRSGAPKTTIEPAFDIEDHLLSLEKIIGRYQDLILLKIKDNDRVSLYDIVTGLDSLDSIRCFFAALFLARDRQVELEQNGEDIMIMLPTNDIQ